MIVKTRKTEEGIQLYQRIYKDREGKTTYFEEDVLSKINFHPSAKMGKQSKIGNTRKPTAGRLIQYAGGKRIQHETPYRLWCKELMLRNAKRIN